MVEVDVWTLAKTDRGSAVLLRPIDSDRIVPIFIGQQEAQGILIGLGKIPMPRPLTHDLMLSIFEKMHLVIDRIDINDMQDGVYYAQISARFGMKKFVFDSRPSDALNIAVRLGCPVYLAEFIIDETSIPESTVSPLQEVSPEELEEMLEDEAKKEEEADIEVTRDIDEAVIEDRLQQVIRGLEAQLNTAVSAEDYEAAAKLRDQIKEMRDMVPEDDNPQQET